jgi:hypothetical protein
MITVGLCGLHGIVYEIRALRNVSRRVLKKLSLYYCSVAGVVESIRRPDKKLALARDIKCLFFISLVKSRDTGLRIL